MTDSRPVQHKPKHLEDGAVFDPKHPAASAFAPAQPGAGVVADDADERGQNLAGGEKASDANETWSDQKEVLEQQHEDNLRAHRDALLPVKGSDEKEGDGEDEASKPAPAKKVTADPKPAPRPAPAKP